MAGPRCEGARNAKKLACGIKVGYMHGHKYKHTSSVMDDGMVAAVALEKKAKYLLFSKLS